MLNAPFRYRLRLFSEHSLAAAGCINYYFIEKYKTKEKYIDLTTRFQTRAVITKDGDWIEPGVTGWFGTDASNEDEETYLNNYYKLVFENAEDDDYITIVDCHI